VNIAALETPSIVAAPQGSSCSSITGSIGPLPSVRICNPNGLLVSDRFGDKKKDDVYIPRLSVDRPIPMGVVRHGKLGSLLSLARSNLLDDDFDIKRFKAFARGILGSGMKFELDVNSGGSITALGSAGVISQNLIWSTDMANSDLWSSLATVFDEVAIASVVYDLVPYNPAFNVSSPGLTIIAHDNDGPPTAGYNGETVAVYQNSEVFCPTLQGSTLGTEANSTGFKPIRLHFSRADQVPWNGPVVTGTTTTGWVSAASPSNIVGGTLVYNGVVNTTNNCIAYSYIARIKARFRFIH
jgi:hypothetical protein